MPSSRWRADLSLAGVALIWGATFIMVKQALHDASTLLFLALRFSLAAVALGIAFRHYGALGKARRSLAGGVLAGIFLFAGYLLQTLGLRHTTASKSAFITGLSIVMVPLVSSFVYKKAPRAAEGAGIVIATVGMGLLTLPAEGFPIQRGDWLTLGCAVAFAVHIVVVGHYSKAVGFEGLSLVQVTTAAALALGSFWWVETPRAVWSTKLLAALAVTGLMATALAFTVQAWAQSKTTATRAALVFALEPVFAWLTSFLLAGETLPLRAVLGAALILSGILAVELKPAAPD